MALIVGNSIVQAQNNNALYIVSTINLGPVGLNSADERRRSGLSGESGGGGRGNSSIGE